MIHIVDIDGKRYPFKYNLIAAVRTEAATGRAFTQIFNDFANGNGRLYDTIEVIHQGLAEGHRLDNKPYNWTWEDVADMLYKHSDATAKFMELVAKDQEPPDSAKKKTGKAAAKP